MSKRRSARSRACLWLALAAVGFALSACASDRDSRIRDEVRCTSQRNCNRG